MERITMIYHRVDEDGRDTISTEFMKQDKDDKGLHCMDICEMFEDFMDASGFSKQNILDYFTE